MAGYDVRRLGSEDTNALTWIAERNGDFTVTSAGTGAPADTQPTQPLSDPAGNAFLSDPLVWFWVAEDEGEPVAFLMCLVQRRRHREPLQVMVYDLGVRSAHRRQGLATRLMEAMKSEMVTQGIGKAWVLADNPVAVAAYERAGFVVDAKQDVSLSLVLPA
jgi:ribosomal protein S18 acetylase RimI-like enzyme